jgi:hypothetical protein
MKRSVFAFVAALALWVLVASVLNRVLRFTLVGYAAAEPTMTFTLAMKLARLTVGGLASLAAGATIGAIAPSSRRVAWIFGIVVLAAFIPTHVQLWAKFPVWYHLTFLVTLVPLVVLGARSTRSRAARASATTAH